MDKPRILVVDDEETLRYIMQALLEEKGCEVRVAESAEKGLAMLWNFNPAVAILDIVLPGMDGLQLLTEVKRISPDTEVVVITSQSTSARARQAIKSGAFDYMEKPFADLESVWTTVHRALEKTSLAVRNREVLDQQEKRARELSSAMAMGAERADEGLSRPFGELLDFFVGQLSEELDAECISVMLVDESARELRLVASCGATDADARKLRVRLGEGIVGIVAESGDPFVARDSDINPAPPVRPSAGPSRSFGAATIALSLAIKSRGKVLGVINVSPRRSRRPFGEEDVAHLSNLAAQLAGTIEGARATERLQKAYDSLKATQAQLVFSERLKAAGQLAAGVAHDFNNVLSIILGKSQSLLRQLDDPGFDRGKAAAGLQTIMKTSLQGVETIKRIQDFTRIRKDVPRSPVDLNTVVRDAVEIARPKWKHQCEAEGRRIEVEVELAEVPPVAGNLYELTQAVGNLIFNAVEAMPTGGRLTFRTFMQAGSVVLEAADTGVGMDEQTRARLFEPFFTTKPAGQGLGTSIISGIITRHRGQITVASKPGAGTTFRIELPPTSAAPPPIERPGAEAVPGALGARVLLVDDEMEVREVYEESLKSGGHDVVVAGGGKEALSLFARHRFDLVITDLSMSGLSGFDVAKEVKRLDPDVRVILLSGWSIQQDDTRAKEAGVDQVLVKPCLFEDLLEAVQNVLRAPVEP